jgi:hypothetical protein
VLTCIGSSLASMISQSQNEDFRQQCLDSLTCRFLADHNANLTIADDNSVDGVTREEVERMILFRLRGIAASNPSLVVSVFSVISLV